MREAVEPLLLVNELVAGYGKKQVLKGISLHIQPGEIVALIGHNGSGKSTLLKTLFGVLKPWDGQMTFAGRPLQALGPRQLRESRISYLPQGNNIFRDMTVRENLEMGALSLRNGERLAVNLERVFELFPVLRNRLEQTAGSLSGGERQMLAIASSLMRLPRLILLDEPSLGLAPPLVSSVFQLIGRINREFDISVLIAEQKVREVLKISQRVVVLRNGAVSFSGIANSLDDDMLRRAYL